jgi:Tol biopolymer transport system component
MNGTSVRPTDEQLRAALERRPDATLLDTVHAEILARAAATPQRRRGLALGWEMPSVVPRATVTGLRAVVALAALTLLLGAALLVASRLQRTESPFADGLVILGPSNGGLHLTGPDGAVEVLDTQIVDWPAFSADGRRVAFWHGLAPDWSIDLLDLETREIQPILDPALVASVEPNGPLQWSPDGRRLLVNANLDGLPVVAVLDVATGAFERIDDLETMRHFNARWSPDGTRLAWLAGNRFDGDAELYVGDADGGRARIMRPEMPAGATAYVDAPRWSSDGARVHIGAGPDGGLGTHLLELDTRDDRVISVHDAPGIHWLLGWSPRNDEVGWTAVDPETDARSLWVMSDDGTDRRELVSGIWVPAGWSPSGRELLYVVGSPPRPPTFEVRAVSVDTGETRRITEIETGAVVEPRGVGWQPVPIVEP